MATIIQRSFAGGEIAPALYARTDQTKYMYGLRTLRNFFVMKHGGAANRPGTRFIREVKDSSKKTVLKPFIFNQENTYIMEFSEKCIRFSRNGDTLYKGSESISGISNTSPAVLSLGSTTGTQVTQFSIFDATTTIPNVRTGAALISDLEIYPNRTDLQDVGDQPYFAQDFNTGDENVSLRFIQIYLGKNSTSANVKIDPDAEIKFQVFEDDGFDQPDFTKLVAESQIPYPDVVGPDLTNVSFNGENLLANTKYWMVARPEVVGYDKFENRVGYFIQVKRFIIPDPTVSNTKNRVFETNTFFSFFKTYNRDTDVNPTASSTIPPEQLGSNMAMKIVVDGLFSPPLSVFDGDEITINDLPDMPEINGRTFKVVSLGNNQFELYNLDGTPFDGAGLNYTSGGSINAVFEIPSPYLESELCDIQINQSADVVIITHPNHPPKELKRIDDFNFSLSDLSLIPGINPPEDVAATGGPTGTIEHTYIVTAINRESFEESIGSAEFSVSKGTPTVANPIRVSWDAVIDASEYNIYKKENGIFGLIGVSGSNSYNDINVSPDSTQTPPRENNPFDDSATGILNITQTNPVVIEYSGDTDIFINDKISFREIEGMTELNGNEYEIFAIDAINRLITLDGVDGTNFSPYISGGIAYKAGLYPSTSTYYQQRLMFANTANKVESVWASKTGQFKNFSTSGNLQDDDSISFTMAGRQVNEIRHLVDLGKLIAFTSTGEWTIEGDGSGILTPVAINPRKHSYNGANTMQPIVINGSAIYVQARGSIVRDLGFDFQIDGYRGNDLTLFASHLFDDYSLVEWAYQQVPHSILWAVRDDGVLLSLTYIREQQMTAWARHDFDGGFVESVTVVPEGDEDVLYVIVRREVDGRTTRYIERMHARNIVDLTDNIFMDSALTYDGRNTSDDTVIVTGGTDWTYNEEIDMNSSASIFNATDIGNEIHVRYSIKNDEYKFDYDGDKIIRFRITGYVSPTQVKVKPHRTVDEDIRNINISSYGKAVDELFGLWHLEGKELSIFGDKFAVGSPFNKSFVKYKVENGSVSLDKPYVVIHAGLPYLSDMETLDVDSNQTESMIDKAKMPTHIAMHVEESRGVFSGSTPPSDDCVDALEGLQEYYVREDENNNDPVTLMTGIIESNIESKFDNYGRVFIRQVDPVPLTILAVAPAGYHVVR